MKKPTMKSHILFSFLFAFLGLNSVTLAQTACFERFMQQGKIAYNQLDFERAISQFIAAKECPDNLDSQLAEAENWLQKSRTGYIEAIRSARDEALKAQAEAEKQARISEANRLAFLAEQERKNGNHTSALTLSFRALEMVEGDPPEFVRQVFSDAVYNSSLQNLEGHQEAVSSVVYAPNGRIIMSRGLDQKAIIRDQDGALIMAISRPGVEMNMATFSPDSKQVLASFEDGSYVLYDISLKTESVVNAHERPVTGAIFSPDGSKILSFSRDNLAKIWDLKGKLLANLEGHQSRILEAVFSPDGQKVLTRSADKSIMLWDLVGNNLGRFPEKNIYMYDMAFAPGSDQFLLAGADRKARLWDISEKAYTMMEHGGLVTRVAFAMSGNLFVTASSDGEIKLWDKKGKPLANMSGNTDGITGLHVSPSGDFILSVSTDHTINLWNTKGELVTTLQHQAPVHTAVFSPDEQKILTASANQEVKIWDLAGNTLQNLSGHDYVIRGALFSPDGGKVITYGDSPRIMMSELADFTYRRLKENGAPALTKEQRERFGLEK
jgi:WD40 repeat protein